MVQYSRNKSYNKDPTNSMRLYLKLSRSVIVSLPVNTANNRNTISPNANAFAI